MVQHGGFEQQAEFILANADQVGALAHPLRIRILALLRDDPHTNQQLAETLGESPARLHFHVKELAKEGLIVLVEQRPKGGVLEKYYLAAARDYRLHPSVGGDMDDVGMLVLESARQGLVRARTAYGGHPPEYQNLRAIGWVSPERLPKLKELLQELASEFGDPGEGKIALALNLLLHQVHEGDDELEAEPTED